MTQHYDGSRGWSLVENPRAKTIVYVDDPSGSGRYAASLFVRAPRRAYDGKYGWMWKWLDGPRKGTLETLWGVDFWAEPTQAAPSRKVRKARSAGKSEKRGWHVVREPGQRLAYRSDNGTRDAFFDPWQRLWTVQLLDGNGSSVPDAIQYTASRDEALAMLTAPVSKQEQAMLDEARDVRPQRIRLRR